MQTKISNIDLSIVIVYYKTPQLLFNCLEAIYRSIEHISFEIIVVDNHSEDDGENFITSNFPEVKWVTQNYNSGFARGNNIGIRLAVGNYILLLNSDTIISNTSIEKSIRILEENPETGVLGCRLLNADGSIQLSAYPLLPGIRKVLEANPIYIYITRNKSIKESRIARIHKLHYEEFEAKWICGAFMLFPSWIFKEYNLFFDEDFFMYCEDVALCQKISKSGYKILFSPEVSIYHLSGASSVSNNIKAAQMIISEWLLMLKLYSKLYFIVYMFFIWLNFLADAFLYFINRLFKRAGSHDKDSYIYRKFVRKLMSKYFFRILTKYRKHTNNGEYLIYG